MGDKIHNRIAVIVGGAEQWQVDSNVFAAQTFASHGYRLFVSSPSFDRYLVKDNIERLEPGTGAGLGALAKALKQVVDDDDELLILTFAHGGGGQPPCLELQDTCYPADGEAFRDLFSLPHAKRTVIMRQCSSGNWVDFFVSDPRTLFISSGSRNAVTSTGDLKYLLDWDWEVEEVPDRDQNGTITWSERFANSMAKGSGASPTFIAGRDYVDTGLSGKTPEPPHYPAAAQAVSSLADYRARLATLKPGDHAIIAVIKEGETKSKGYRATFERLARENQGRNLFLIIDHGDAPEFSGELKLLKVDRYPTIILSDYRGYKVSLTSVEAMHNPLANLAQVYSNVQFNPSYWAERLEKDAPAWWPRVPDDFRNNPEVWTALRRYCANQASCPKDNKTQMSKFIFSEAVQRHPEIFQESPLLIQNIPLTPEFSEVRRGAWKILVKKGLSNFWHELSDEFRADPALRAALSENGQNADATIRSVLLESIRKHPNAYPQSFIQGIPLTPEWNELRREAWRMAVDQDLALKWHEFSPEQRRDPVLLEILAEKGRKTPRPNSLQLRFGAGPYFSAGRQGIQGGIDLGWKPVHFADDQAHLGLRIGYDYGENSHPVESGYKQRNSLSSIRLGSMVEWNPSSLGFGLMPFVSHITERMAINRNDDGKNISSYSASREGIGVELSVRYMMNPDLRRGSYSPYLGGLGVYCSYAYQRLLGRGLDSSDNNQHLVTAGVVTDW